MRYLIEIEQPTLYWVEVDADSAEAAQDRLAIRQGNPCGDPEPLPFIIRSIRELEG
jgi:hypothetical protein